jgi:hypothetical protein
LNLGILPLLLAVYRKIGLAHAGNAAGTASLETIFARPVEPNLNQGTFDNTHEIANRNFVYIFGT